MKKSIVQLVLLSSVLLSLICLPSTGLASGPFELKPYDINSRMMRSTFKIEGSDLKGNTVLGTAFVVAQESTKNVGSAYFILITAAHVLEDIKDNNATLILRRIIGNTFVKHPFNINIRENGKRLWVRHPRVDVAAMRIRVPIDADIQMVTTNLLATDKMLEEFEIHPGDELLVLGYPYGAQANEAGFPILRSGKIASYPLIPTDKTMSFLLDFPVYEGNSGGPVYLYSQNRLYSGGTHIGVVKFVVGIVSEEMRIVENVKLIGERGVREHTLGLAVIIHARFLKDVVEMLPPVNE
jgi:S1-C subfamily serine protease